MRLVTDSGLWCTGQQAAHPQLTAVLEVSGAVLSWTVDDPSTAAQITFTTGRADWLWHVLGAPGHSALAAALDGRTLGEAVELTGIDAPWIPRPPGAARARALAAPVVAGQPA